MDNHQETTLPKATVYHDGECPLCQKEVTLMQKVDVSKAIRWVDINKDKQALEDAGITFQQAMDRIHVADESQQLHTGVAGFMNIWTHLPYYRRLVPVVKHTPFLLPLLERAYSWFAKHRLRLTRRQ
jgi:predicted DCC family thiol-disulfide oxidoreductase YuxK